MVIGIDLGTTGLKVSLFQQDGRLLGSAYCEYPIQVPQPGWAEQDPREWFDNLCHLGMPHHVAVFEGHSIDVLKRGAATTAAQRWVKEKTASITANLQLATSLEDFGQRLLRELLPALGGGVAGIEAATAFRNERQGDSRIAGAAAAATGMAWAGRGSVCTGGGRCLRVNPGP